MHFQSQKEEAMFIPFEFKGFRPDDELRSRADQTLERILDASPYGAAAAAMLEKEGDGYRCSIDVYSRFGPFIASAKAAKPAEALTQAERALSRKFVAWKARRSQSWQRFAT
jgi:hypothetical protein